MHRRSLLTMLLLVLLGVYLEQHTPKRYGIGDFDDNHMTLGAGDGGFRGVSTGDGRCYELRDVR